MWATLSIPRLARLWALLKSMKKEKDTQTQLPLTASSSPPLPVPVLVSENLFHARLWAGWYRSGSQPISQWAVWQGGHHYHHHLIDKAIRHKGQTERSKATQHTKGLAGVSLSVASGGWTP